jgi:hypothetical protein
MSQLQERKRLEMFSFDSPGQSLRGRLIEIDPVEISQRPALRYVIHEEEEDRCYSLLGTVDLNNKIRRSDVGRILEIRYEGSEKRNGGNPIKRFRIFAEST